MSLQPIKSHKTFGGLTQFWEHDSTNTKTKMKFSTFIPHEKPAGCLIWLSGLTCTDENFITKAGAQRYLAENKLMVICPDTSPRGTQLPDEHTSWDFGSGAGFYVNATTPGYRDHYRMYDYISEEIHGLVQSQFGVAGDRIAISGHSMGGHGALILGLREPSKFRSVSAFSPIVNPANVPWGEKAFTGYLGDNRTEWDQYDATRLIESGRRHSKKILIDQGLKDEFLEKQLVTQRLIEAAGAAGQPVDARFHDGYDHSYYFISSFIDAHIEFHARNLGVIR